MRCLLGRFGHHPDPATDFCVEVEDIIGIKYNVDVGLEPEGNLRQRIERAMDFRVGGDPIAVQAKQQLREMVKSAGKSAS